MSRIDIKATGTSAKPSPRSSPGHDACHNVELPDDRSFFSEIVANFRRVIASGYDLGALSLIGCSCVVYRPLIMPRIVASIGNTPGKRFHAHERHVCPLTDPGSP